MIVVDTSVWVAATRQPDAGVAVTLRALIDADEVSLALPVRLELMAGVARQDRTAFGGHCPPSRSSFPRRRRGG